MWLNLVLQPCAMALESTNHHDCPNCPPEHASPHTDHGKTTDLMPLTEMPCAAGTDCSIVDNINFDGRNTRLEPKDLPNELPLAVSPAQLKVPVFQTSVCPDWHRLRSPPPGNSVALNILHCVYLK